jgi:hypothetical protein
MIEIASTVFVYVNRNTSKVKILSFDDAKEFQETTGFLNGTWSHTATINPARWIECLLNNPEDMTRQIIAATTIMPGK